VRGGGRWATSGRMQLAQLVQSPSPAPSAAQARPQRGKIPPSPPPRPAQASPPPAALLEPQRAEGSRLAPRAALAFRLRAVPAVARVASEQGGRLVQHERAGLQDRVPAHLRGDATRRGIGGAGQGGSGQGSGRHGGSGARPGRARARSWGRAKGQGQARGKARRCAPAARLQARTSAYSAQPCGTSRQLPASCCLPPADPAPGAGA
jgi:hypothetical protein